MSRSRRLLLAALCILPWSLGGLAAGARAQTYDDTRRSLGLLPDPIARSPRLLGMGRLTLVDDRNNRISLWDFAANPTGVMDADSVTTFDIRPATSSSAGLHDQLDTGRERQDIASREVRASYEAWRRTPGGATFGLFGDAAMLREDGLAGESSELRRTFRVPRIEGVVNGRMPRFRSDRLEYSFGVFYGVENRSDQYRSVFATATGDYLGKQGAKLRPPNFFVPDQAGASTLGATVGLSYRTPFFTPAIGLRASSTKIKGENSSVVHTSLTDEDRPYYTFQASAVGHAGTPRGPAAGWPVEWGFDTRHWKSSSEADWSFTLKAGINQDPFNGRGNLFDRTENGNQQRYQLRVRGGRWQANASAGRWRRETEIRPTSVLDSTSYNRFIFTTFLRSGADTLTLPDFVSYNNTMESSWNMAYGAAYPLGRGLVGAEYHYSEEKLDQWVAGPGPVRRVWDGRAGVEYPCSRVMTGRLGYVYRSDDHDLRNAADEFMSHTLTAGTGLTVPGAAWTFDLGWAIEWLRPDFADDTHPRESRQQMAAQVHWVF